MIAVLIVIIAYLLTGTAALSIVKWHDRHCDSVFDKIADGNDDDAMVVILWPLLAIMAIMYVIFVWIPSHFAKVVMTLVTALIYTIKAIVRKEDGEKESEEREK